MLRVSFWRACCLCVRCLKHAFCACVYVEGVLCRAEGMPTSQSTQPTPTNQPKPTKPPPGLTLDDISSVELIGGATRIPAVGRVVEEVGVNFTGNFSFLLQWEDDAEIAAALRLLTEQATQQNTPLINQPASTPNQLTNVRAGVWPPPRPHAQREGGRLPRLRAAVRHPVARIQGARMGVSA